MKIFPSRPLRPLVLLTALFAGGTFLADAANPNPSDKETSNLNVVAYLDARANDIRQPSTDEINLLEKAKAAAGKKFEATTLIVRTYEKPPAALWAGLTFAQTPPGTTPYSMIANQYAYLKRPVDPGDWQGTRIYRIKPNDTASIKSAILSHQTGTTPPSAKELSKFAADNFRPDYVNLFYMGAHGGHGWYGGMPLAQFDEGLSLTEKKTGKKFDFFMIDTCLNGNLPMLKVLSRHGKVAFVSENWIGMSTIPESLADIFSDAALKGGTPLQVADRTMKILNSRPDVLNDAGWPLVIAAINLDKVPALDQAYTELINRCNKEAPNAVKEALEGAHRVSGKTLDAELSQSIQNLDVSGYFSSLNQGTLSTSYADLKIFLSNLRQKNLSPEIRRSIARVDACLNDVVIGRAVSRGYEAFSGVAIEK